MRASIVALALVAGCSSASDESPVAPATDTGSEDTLVVAEDTAPPRCSPDRTADDRPDDAEGYMIRLWYVVPSDGADEEHDRNGRVERAALAFNDWLAKQTGGPKLRLDTCDGKLDIGFKRLAKTDAQIKATGAYVLQEIQKEMPRREKKIHAAYYGGGSTYSCGGGMWPPELVGNTAAMYLKGTPPGPTPCDAHPLGREDVPLGYMEIGLLHEIFHTLGAAAECAPHHFERGHVSGSNKDLLYRGAEYWDVGPQTLLDIDKDDYWGHANTGCLDVSKSVFLDPLPEGALPPPRW